MRFGAAPRFEGLYMKERSMVFAPFSCFQYVGYFHIGLLS